jgi:AhpD family alkylhydroperoxidase
MKIQIFDPPMCCASGVCGPSVDPELVRFAADLDWLVRQGGEVERYNLTQQPAAFAGNPVVRDALGKDGNDCLPLTLVDDAVVCKGKYPTRAELAGYAGIEMRPSIFTDAVKELVAIGAAIGSNCEMCFKHHYNEARKLGVSKEDMRAAVEMAKAVKSSPARSISELADKYLRGAASPRKPASTSPSCCCPSGDEVPTGGKNPGKGSCC